MEDQLVLPNHHRVAGVGAALVADDEIGALGEHVDDLALAFVSPLGADDHHAVTLGPKHPEYLRPATNHTKKPRRGSRRGIL